MRFTRLLARQHVSAFLHEPGTERSFHQTLKACKTNNVDMASALSSDFFSLQRKLFVYRIARLGHEIRYMCQNPRKCLPSYNTAITAVVAMPILYYTAMCCGRLSVDTLIPPPAFKSTMPVSHD